MPEEKKPRKTKLVKVWEVNHMTLNIQIVQENVDFDAMFTSLSAYDEFEKFVKQLLLEAVVTKEHKYHESIIDMWAVMIEWIASSKTKLASQLRQREQIIQQNLNQ